MPGRTDSRIRLLVLLVVFLVASRALTARWAYWQVLAHDRLVAAAADQTTATLETPSQRGDIYDRSGAVILATPGHRGPAPPPPRPRPPSAAGPRPGSPPFSWSAMRRRPSTCARSSPRRVGTWSSVTGWTVVAR